MPETSQILPKFKIGQELFFTDLSQLLESSFSFGVGRVSRIHVRQKDHTKDFNKQNMEFTYTLLDKQGSLVSISFEHHLFESLLDLENYVFRYLNTLKN